MSMQGMPPAMPPNRLPAPGNTLPVSPMAQFGNPMLQQPVQGGMPPQMNPMMSRKSGGGIPQFAVGGFPSSSEADPWYARQEGRADQLHVGGLFGGSAPGRADTLPVSVMTDSHVLPADVVSGLGDGNSLAGASVIDKMMSSLPYGIQPMRGHGAPQLRLPAAPRPMAPESRGGRKEDHGRETVPIAASSGEYNVHPQSVYAIGLQSAKNMKLDPTKLTPRKVMDIGHDILDKWILEVRKRTIKTMGKLAPPKRD